MMTAKDASVEPVPGPIRMAEVLAAFSLATDLGTGKSMGHALRACYLGMAMAGELHLPRAQRAELYYSFLLMHSGCAALSWALTPLIKGDELAAIGDITLRDDTKLLEMLGWLKKNVSPAAPLPARIRNLLQALLHNPEEGDIRGVCEVAARVAQRLDMPAGVQGTVRHYLERWDGKGPYGLAGSAIPLNARLIHLALKMEACHTAYGRAEAEAMARSHRGTIFGPEVVDVFLAVAKSARLWAMLSAQDLWDVVLDLEPDTPYRHIDETKLDDVALAAADFVDLKSPATAGHSRETAHFAVCIARRMDLPWAETATIRRAALVHDLGQLALPGYIVGHPHDLSAADREKLRLHPYYTERVLSRVPALAAAAAIAGRHHERIDGTGYYRGLSGDEIPVGARILALADDFQDRLQAGAGGQAADPQAVLKGMEPDAGTRFAPDCFAALAEELGVAAPPVPEQDKWAGGLTGREVEVLRQVARGDTNRQIAQELVISERTVAHHLEHIYDKIGVSSRAAAVFFAMEHELIP